MPISPSTSVMKKSSSLFKDKPDVLANYRAGNREMEDGARKCGIDSLQWLIEGARPEHGPLLEEFFSVLGPELATHLKQEVARICKVIL